MTSLVVSLSPSRQQSTRWALSSAPILARSPPSKAQDHLASGDLHVSTYWSDGNRAALSDAVQLYRLALAVTTDVSDEMIEVKVALVDALRLQFEEGLAGDEELLEALNFAEAAVGTAVKGTPIYVDALRALVEILLRHVQEAERLQRAAEVCRELADLTADMTAAVHDQALALCTEVLIGQSSVSGEQKYIVLANEQVDRAKALVGMGLYDAYPPFVHLNFSKARGARFSIAHDPADLYTSIDGLMHLVQISPPTHPLLCNYWLHLGFGYYKKWKLRGAQEDFDARRIHAYSEANKRVSGHHPSRTFVYGNYVNALYDRFRAQSRAEDLTEALTVCKTVLNYVFTGPQWPLHAYHYVANHSQYVISCYAQSGKTEVLDEAIGLLLHIFPVTPSLYHGHFLGQLGQAYFARYTAYGRQEDLENAIMRLEQSLQQPNHHQHYNRMAYELAECLLARVDFSGLPSDLGHVIQVLQTALTYPDVYCRGQIYSLLGAAVLRRAALTGRDQDIVDSIQYQHTAMELLPTEHADHHICQYRIGQAEYDAFRHSRRIGRAINSIEAYKKAISSMSPQSSTRARYLMDLARSQLAVAHSEGRQHFEDALKTLHEAADHVSSWPADRYAAAVESARIAHSSQQLQIALDSYRLAISLLPEVAWIGLEDELRMQRLATQPADVSQDAAACAIELGLSDVAVELLDSGRSVLWNSGQELRADLARLTESAPDIARELAEINAALAFKHVTLDGQAESQREHERQRVHQLAAKRSELIGLAREMPGLEHFLLPASFDTLRQAGRHGPVIILNSSAYRCDALLIHEGRKVELIPLRDVTCDQLKAQAQALHDALRLAKDKRGVGFLESSLLDLLRSLWNSIGRPVCESLACFHIHNKSYTPLESAKRVWWCPTGPMSFLPIHACGPYAAGQMDLTDLVISSYTPTLSALVRAQSVATTSCSPLVICQPNVPERAPLPCAMEELAIVQDVFHGYGTYLVGERGTMGRTERLLREHSWVHVSTHGTQDYLHPLESSIALYDGPLKLSTLAQAQLPNPEFAFLSACHSARGTPWLPDESMHLAAGFMFAGYRSVVATSWGIADKDAPQVVRAFYRHLTRDGNAPKAFDTAAALRVAVLRLRDSGVPTYRWVPFIHLGA